MSPFLRLVFISTIVAAASPCMSIDPTSQLKSAVILEKYKPFLDEHTIESRNGKPHKSRHYTFKKAFELFEQNNGEVIVELGTTRSFVHGGLPGCCSTDTRYWEPTNPAVWDWGAGGFTRMAAECLAHRKPVIHTVDCASAHLEICKVVTKSYAHLIRYHCAYSQNFLRQCAPRSIDLLYLDTGNIDYETALLQFEEAQIIVERDLIAHNGIILIDDVKHPVPGEPVPLGKARFSIPYFLEHGFELVEDEYQVILRRSKSNTVQ